ncbi:Octaprenyl-diphosphate synthase [Phaeobacter italicus]|jgi:octaprenyl-diphosphate synthase|uniref:Octaprenyl diphosphate synthase n=2 Tax=Phaeobacter italicus TaxID=481446 RepID=A0A0H5CZF1_9RHOB|nr:Octaprenyl-diphosphate synthase [Phaeobacter italicus]
MIFLPHHQSSRENTDTTFKDAHIYVHLKAVYILSLKKGGGKGHDGWVGAAQKFLHRDGSKGKARALSSLASGKTMNQILTQKPHDMLAATLSEEMAAVNTLIRTRMASKHAPRIPEVTAHLVEAGGKRLRPMLTLAAARLCGYSGDNHVKLAATVEFIHTATLLHDDVVDESGQRRGRPTANLLWDNKSSVLVGDYLFARSFQLMVETGSLRVLDILANASATIAEGEVLQMTAASDLATDEDIYLQVVRGKTAALFSAATQAGGVIAEASEAEVDALYAYGDALGIAFQIADDLLDYQGDSSATGKNVGDDFRERKLTLPVIKAVAQATAEERAFWVRTIEKGRQDEGDLDHALALMDKYDTLGATRRDAMAWVAKAQDALTALPEDPIRQMLHDLADYVVARLA